MRKLTLAIALTLATLVSNAQSIGSFYGSTGSNNQLNACWGAWVSTEKFGIEYSYSTNINLDIFEKYDYITRTAQSYGVTYVMETEIPHLKCIPGIGVQSVYSTFDKEIHNKIWQKDIYPYVSIAGEYDLNSVFNLRIRLQVGQVSNVGAGVGIRLGKY